MDDNVNPFPWIKENIVSSSAGGSSLHRQGVCVISQETTAKIYPCANGHCDRCGSSAVRRYQ